MRGIVCLQCVLVQCTSCLIRVECHLQKTYTDTHTQLQPSMLATLDPATKGSIRGLLYKCGQEHLTLFNDSNAIFSVTKLTWKHQGYRQKPSTSLFCLNLFIYIFIYIDRENESFIYIYVYIYIVMSGCIYNSRYINIYFKKSKELNMMEIVHNGNLKLWHVCSLFSTDTCNISCWSILYYE